MARNAAFDVVAFFFHDHCVGVLFQMKGDCLKSGSSSGNTYFKGREFSGHLKAAFYFSASLFCSGVPSTLSLSKEVITCMRGAGLVAEPVKLHL